MKNKQLLTRTEFRERCLERDGGICVNCKKEPATEVHHIIERRLFNQPEEFGGYFIDNGASVCNACHRLAEQTLVSCEDLREKIGIKDIVLPSHLYDDNVYTKWGDIINGNGTRSKGELFYDESVQRILKEGKVLHLYETKIKYPRSFHLPWSPGMTKDDRALKNCDHFVGRRVIVTLKLDGENTTMYNNAIHARSLDGDSHPSQSHVRNIHGRIAYDIPSGMRLCGENLYAYHSIRYSNLESFFYLFSIWNDKNQALSWDDTVEFAELLDLVTVPVIYDDIWDEEKVKESFKPFQDRHEGYVVRVADSFDYGQFRFSLAKYVRKGHVNKDRVFWKNGWYPSDENVNKIGNPGPNRDPY